jgi:hypothetical protein
MNGFKFGLNKINLKNVVNYAIANSLIEDQIHYLNSDMLFDISSPI